MKNFHISSMAMALFMTACASTTSSPHQANKVDPYPVVEEFDLSSILDGTESAECKALYEKYNNEFMSRKIKANDGNYKNTIGLFKQVGYDNKAKKYKCNPEKWKPLREHYFLP